MTAQVSDSFRFDNNNYSLVATSKPLEFDPKEYGITPQPFISACWQGFWCAYNITNDGIFLEDLYINSEDDYYPEINGVSPFSGNMNLYMGHHVYSDLHLNLDYTGKILVGEGFLQEYYIHMGNQRFWAYEILKELVFENGVLVGVNDRSNIAVAVREAMKQNKGFNEYLYENSQVFVDGNFALDSPDRPWSIGVDVKNSGFGARCGHEISGDGSFQSICGAKVDGNDVSPNVALTEGITDHLFTTGIGLGIFDSINDMNANNEACDGVYKKYCAWCGSSLVVSSEDLNKGTIACSCCKEIFRIVVEYNADEDNSIKRVRLEPLF